MAPGCLEQHQAAHLSSYVKTCKRNLPDLVLYTGLIKVKSFQKRHRSGDDFARPQVHALGSQLVCVEADQLQFIRRCKWIEPGCHLSVFCPQLDHKVYTRLVCLGPPFALRHVQPGCQTVHTLPTSKRQ